MTLWRGRGDDRSLLFSGGDLADFLEQRKSRMTQEINGLEKNRVLNASTDTLRDQFVEAYNLERILLHEDAITTSVDEAQVDVSRDFLRNIPDPSRPYYITGTEVTLHIPFTGDAELFHYKASTFSLSGRPEGRVFGGEIALSSRQTAQDPAAMQRDLDSKLADLTKHVQWTNSDVEGFNHSLSRFIEQHIEARRQKLLRDDNLAAALRFPLRRREHAPATYVTPAVQRKRPVVLPTPPSVGFRPEPTIDLAEYEHILQIMKGMVSVMERSPEAFRTLGEEDIRQHFLVQLNGQYEGGATGETFNMAGKTDILIRDGDRNVFIAECKLWDGPASLTGALDQLLSYATWRDSKTAILVFNRNKNFSDVIDKVSPTIEAHPNHVRTIAYPDGLGFRYIFRSRTDPNRELLVTVLPFDVPR